MLQIVVPAMEEWDPIKNEFVYDKEWTLQLEHSLVSISKWEAKWCKPFLTKDDKNYEETVDYIKCMSLTKNVPDDVYYRVPKNAYEIIGNYIDAPMTATVFYNETNNGSSRETITSEIIYFMMIAYNIPFECQKWHLNRLLTLIKVCKIRNQPPKKMGRQELIARNRALNDARRKSMNTRG